LPSAASQAEHLQHGTDTMANASITPPVALEAQAVVQFLPRQEVEQQLPLI
jgi:hypothetical protein